jgi:hypothetical protein
VLKVGSDDQAKMFLSEKEVYRSTASRQWVSEEDTVPGIELKAGLNALIFKVVNEHRDWAGSVWIADADGQPVPGLQVTLDPDAVK